MRTAFLYVITFFILYGFAQILSSCDSEDCVLTTNSYCYFGFCDSVGQQVKLSDSITVCSYSRESDTVYIYYNQTDTIVSQTPIDTLLENGYQLSFQKERIMNILINRMYGAESIQLPLSYSAREDTFFLMYSQRLIDTLWVKHQNIPYFTSMECGSVMHYTLLDIQSTNHLIDSIKILNPNINNALKENVKIYYTVSY